jgi:hypothetical protein
MIDVQKDFEAWSGGFPPESDDQITVYIDYALPKGNDPEEVRAFLRNWMNETE